MHRDQEDPQQDMVCTESGVCVDVAFLYNLTLQGFEKWLNWFTSVNITHLWSCSSGAGEMFLTNVQQDPHD